MNIKDRVIFWGHYDEIDVPDWHSHNNFWDRYNKLNLKKNLTELERKELDLLVYGTEEEYLTFLREHEDKKKS